MFWYFGAGSSVKCSINLIQCTPIHFNKLKSLKVAQVKDEMDVDEDDGYDGVCDVVLWWCVMMCGDVVLWCSVVVCYVMSWCDVVCEMNDFKLWRGFDDGRTDGQTNGHWWL